MNKHRLSGKSTGLGLRFNPQSAIRNPKWAAAAAVVAALLVATAANAGPIRFDNPTGAGHFDWTPQGVGTPTYDVYLNIFADAAGQTPTAGGSGAYKQRCYSPSGTDVRRAGPTGEGPEYVLAPSGGLKLLLPVSEGEAIPTAGAAGFTHSAFAYTANAPQGDPSTLLTAGLETYLGVQFFANGVSGDVCYGWIGVVPEWRTFDFGGVPTDALVLDTFAWGYETQPGVPIAAGIPEPTTLALLALGGLALLRRRR